MLEIRVAVILAVGQGNGKQKAGVEGMRNVWFPSACCMGVFSWSTLSRLYTYMHIFCMYITLKLKVKK